MSRFRWSKPIGLAVMGAATLGLWQLSPETLGFGQGVANAPPIHQVDPFWPKPLPNNWRMGQVAGITVDQYDRVWLVQRPRSLTEDEAGSAQTPPRADCCDPAPAVMVFDVDGNLLDAWGGPGEGYEWPDGEHGIFVDHNDNVWLAGNAQDDHVVLKFSMDGTFLLQIGRKGESNGNNDTVTLGRPADMHVDPETNELYVADGYRNNRIIVFDADSGEYLRHWGAYGNPPPDVVEAEAYDPGAEPFEHFRTPVHCVRPTHDGLVYVCDRVNNRIQVFEKDGTFVKEEFYARDTLGPGSVWDLRATMDPDETWMVKADGSNQVVRTLLRETLEVVAVTGRPGRNAGEFHWVHNIAVDSMGNFYTAEVDTGKRAQKFRLMTQLHHN